MTGLSASSVLRPSTLWMGGRAAVGVAGLILLVALGGCGDDGSDSSAPATKPAATAGARSAEAPTPRKKAPQPELAENLPNALVLGLASFEARKPGDTGAPKPLPAELEFLVRRGGAWEVVRVTDADSDVFHKAMAYPMPDGTVRLLTAGGSKAMLKLWSKQDGSLVSETIWQKDFGGQFSRMRDIEVGDVDGDGSAVIAVATHDQGVVAVARPKSGGGFAIEELDEEKDTFVHEVELGDVDGDGTIEIYATPSEPNRLDGSPQSGRVVRYTPAKGEGRVVVADLGDRHAKEILVADVDQNGRDELYVIVEGQKDPKGKGLLYRTEVWRYEADTPPDKGVVIAELDDRLGRFLTVGDLDGDGKQEIVAALFSAGVWWLRPGEDPMRPWKKRSIDRKSGGFEHAAIATDLDGDGRDELYVASDKDASVRRYSWNGRRLVREEIFKRTHGRSVFTWNLMPVPVELVPEN